MLKTDVDRSEWDQVLRRSGLDPFEPVPEPLRHIGISLVTQSMQIGDLVVDPQVANALRAHLRERLNDREDLGKINNDLETRLSKVPLYQIRGNFRPGKEVRTIIMSALSTEAEKLARLLGKKDAYELELEKQANHVRSLTWPYYCGRPIG